MVKIREDSANHLKEVCMVVSVYVYVDYVGVLARGSFPLETHEGDTLVPAVPEFYCSW